MSFNAASLRLLAEKGLSIEDVIEVATAMESRSKAAERQARYRRRKAEDDVTDDDVTRYVTPPPKKRSKTPPVQAKARTGKGSFELPAWVPAEPWRAFVAMRKAMPKVPFSDDAKRGIVADLDRLRAEGHDPEKLLLKAVKLGWRGVFPADDTKASNAYRRPESMNTEQLRAAIRFAEDHDDPDRAAELKRQLAALTQKPPDPKVAQLIAQAGKNLRAATG